LLSDLPANRTITSPVSHVRYSKSLSIAFSQIQFHHLQSKYRLGMAMRNDAMGIPMCYPCHSIFQKRGERLYWEEIGIDPGIYAKELWEEWLERKQ